MLASCRNQDYTFIHIKIRQEEWGIIFWEEFLKISSIVYALVSTGLMFVDIDCYAGNNYNYNIHL